MGEHRLLGGGFRPERAHPVRAAGWIRSWWALYPNGGEPPIGGIALERTGFFTLALGERRFVGKALLTGSGDDERMIEVFKDEAAPDPLTDNIVRGFAYRSARVLVPLFALVLLIGSWIAWRRMRPIEQVSAIAETIGPHTLNIRLPERDLPAEDATDRAKRKPCP